MKTGYTLLTEMVNVKSLSSSEIGIEPKTARVLFIISELKRLGLNFIEDEFYTNEDKTRKRINLYVPFVKKSLLETFFSFFKSNKNTLTFTAHHDIVNPESQNCQDNTASVCNLLHLCAMLKGKSLKKNVVVCFLDGEEVGGIGSKEMASKMKSNVYPFVNCNTNINLELTGVGQNLWADFNNFKNSDSNVAKQISEKNKNVISVQTPFSDSVMFRNKNIDSVCIGLWNDADVKQYNNKNFPDTWMLCHRNADTIDKISSSDMTTFVVETLLPLAR